MDGIKILAKNEKELETLTQRIRICSHDIGIEFGIKKSAKVIMKNGKREAVERIEL